jgi:hypothetical protein
MSERVWVKLDGCRVYHLFTAHSWSVCRLYCKLRIEPQDSHQSVVRFKDACKICWRRR